ncbi:uncharacterized protein EI97DRAFT_455688 [Westerdykella ornata]|uniref:Ubiquitin 3 binding protein But2 C-terminal domain-containing protein n=1 Tax=Westerdykella ornata TaxID=318751 RepID=A0A6A6JSA5_WESOR|nr:uncharacterized protein EI97DRAFT_455688 [Westerdykella ornata]KAF2279442.1 hypothetical protein EI97DRAFT_455688 [Westerdykella ornata]
MRSAPFVPLLFGLSALADTLVDRQFPHLIIPVDKREPDRVFGTQFSGRIEQAVHTEISFDVPSNNGATHCRLNFYINTDPSKNAPRTLWGEAPYRFNISSIEHRMDKDRDTWNNRPRITGYVGQVELTHSGSVTTTGLHVPCWKGQVAQYVLYPDDPDRDFGYTWFELDYDPPHGITYEMFV